MLALVAAVTVIAIVQSEKGDISIENPSSSDGINGGDVDKPTDSGGSGKDAERPTLPRKNPTISRCRKLFPL